MATELEYRASRVSGSLKQLHADLESYCDIADDVPGAQGMQTAMKALHEKIRRFGEKNHPDVIAYGGNT